KGRVLQPVTVESYVNPSTIGLRELEDKVMDLRISRSPPQSGTSHICVRDL
ncbi:Hypothetical predicted protein, partial [Marmota monax]